MNSIILDFWSWFHQNASNLLTVESADDPLFRLANARLREIDPRLGLLFSEVSESREVIITANGEREAFGIVEQIVRSAPTEMRCWRITAFKPSMGFPKRTQYGRVDVRPADLWVIPLKKKNDPSFFGLQVGIPNYEPELRGEYRNCLYEVLEIALGERRFSERVDYVDVSPLPSSLEGWARLTQIEDVLSYYQDKNA